MTNIATRDRRNLSAIKRAPRHVIVRSAICAVCIVIGTGLIVTAYRTARRTTNLDYVTTYWMGYVLALAGLLSLMSISRRQSWGSALAIALGVWTYLPKFLMSRHGPVYFDEWGHFRHLKDLAATGNVFGNDNFIPIVKYFPGLSLTSYVVQVVTRTSAWTAALLTSALAHTATAAAVYRIAERLGMSSRRAVFATALYAVGPTFAFFDAQYGYETLGLAFAFWTVANALNMITLCVVPDDAATTDRRYAKRRFVRSAVATVTLSLCTIFTHHLSALVVSAMLVAICLVTARLGALDRHRRAIATAVVAECAIAAGLWIGVVANTAAYLSPKVTSGFHQLLQIVGLAGAPAQAHTGPAQRSVLSTTAVPRFEIVCGYAAIALLVAAHCVALVALWRRRRRDRGLQARLRWFCAVLGLGFFLSLPFVLTSTGAEVAHRSWAFSWLGLSATLAASPIPAWWKRQSRAAIAAGGGLLVVLAIGMAVDGTNADYRFPGPYKFGSDSRSLNSDEYQLAHWFDSTGRSGGVVTDRFTSTVLTGYTRLEIPAPTQLQLYRIFTDPLDMPADVVNRMRRAGYSYFVLDSNFIGRLPRREEFYPGSDSFYPVDQRGLTTLLRQHGSAQLKLIKTIGHYFVFELV